MFTSVKSGYPDQAQLAYNMALAEYRSNDFREAEATLLDLIGTGHQTSEAYNLLAWSYYKLSLRRQFAPLTKPSTATLQGNRTISIWEKP